MELPVEKLHRHCKDMIRSAGSDKATRIAKLIIKCSEFPKVFNRIRPEIRLLILNMAAAEIDRIMTELIYDDIAESN